MSKLKSLNELFAGRHFKPDPTLDRRPAGVRLAAQIAVAVAYGVCLWLRAAATGGLQLIEMHAMLTSIATQSRFISVWLIALCGPWCPRCSTQPRAPSQNAQQPCSALPPARLSRLRRATLPTPAIALTSRVTTHAVRRTSLLLPTSCPRKNTCGSPTLCSDLPHLRGQHETPILLVTPHAKRKGDCQRTFVGTGRVATHSRDCQTGRAA